MTDALPAPPLVSLRHVRKSYRAGGMEAVAVSDVSLDIGQGDLIALVGPSGCGKTTILKILAGLQEADGGEVRIGQCASHLVPGRDVGMVFQQPLLLKWRTILQNVMLPAEILGLPRGPSLDRARELISLVGLEGQEDKYPYQLSGGMQQRAAIARALVHAPKLVLLDEPFGALDALTREKMNLELLRIWQRSGSTLVLVTHSIQEAVLLGTRCAVLTAAPARMADVFDIELPFPRTLDIKTTEQFGHYVRRIYQRLGMA